VSAQTLAEANSKAGSVETPRCTRSTDCCIVIEYTETSPHRVPLITAHEVSGKNGHAYWARWTYRTSGGGMKADGWKKSSWTGDNGRAP
jgi:hypothetical protein